jgi:hypothetical protein
MNVRSFAFATVISTVLLSNSGSALQHEMPEGMTHAQHLALLKKQAEMKARGNASMGFDQDKTTHHFYLRPDGGTIQVETNDAADTSNRDELRAHLKTISMQFAKGDFTAPFKTHAETPPGVPIMQRMKSAISYAFEEKPTGAAVRIHSKDREAIKAVHEFLRYQIKEHGTGDPIALAK